MLELNRTTGATDPNAAREGNGDPQSAPRRDTAAPSNGDVVELLKRFFAVLRTEDKALFLGHEVAAHLEDFLASDQGVSDETRRAVRKLMRGCPEIVLDGDVTYAMLRPSMGVKRIVRLSPMSEALEPVTRGEFLHLKDRQVQGAAQASRHGLVIDFLPFFRGFPRVTEPSEMGDGISLLNRRLAAQSYENPERFREAFLGFLRDKKLCGESILVSPHIGNADQFGEKLVDLRSAIDDLPDDADLSTIIHVLREHDFESGWGDTPRQVGDTLRLLSLVLESADPDRFAELLHRLPLIRTVLMVSPHGWFAQEGVLGRPDTGGQVTYVLDQARALETGINQRLRASGLDMKGRVVVLTRLIPEADGTTCDEPHEPIYGSEDSWILRVPFRDTAGGVHPHWVSRFRIWPFLEDFAYESRQAIVNELLGKPDLIVGHYTDGNLVAHLLAEQLDVTHCACVHALEKTKYLLSDAYWADLEDQYHFSLHFTADLLAYNSADFIISSSFREIGGTAHEMGMIEAYDLFSMPGLYRVQSGFNPRLARHNIVPPGASEQFFFPHEGDPRRVPQLAESLAEWALGAEPAEGCVGHLDDPELPPVFAMARMDKIKNLSGLVEIFGKHERLQRAANLVLITSINDPELSSDTEEVEEIHRTYALLDEYNLHGKVRWCAARLDKSETGEVYRVMADRRGAFAQPAFMETFGLTVIEAMACGLPVVGTCFGGPSEIIQAGVSGEIADPNDHQAFGDALANIVGDGEAWRRYSEGGIRRVEQAYTWGLHASRLLGMANVYSFWDHADVMNRPALDRYIHTLFHTVYRPRAEALA